MTRRSRLLVSLCLLAAGGTWCLLAAGGRAYASAAGGVYVREIASREAGAKHEAAALLGALQLPAGAAASPSEPAADGGYLARAVFGSAGRPNAVDEPGWWVVPGTPAQVLAYVHEHMPSGLQWWSGHHPPQAVPSHEAAILRGTALGALAERLLTIRVAQLPGGQTGLRADGEVLWLVPGVRIPQRARLLSVTARLVGPFHLVARAVILRSASQIAAITRLVNGAREVHPSFLPRRCPKAFGVVRLAFYGRAGAPPLARVTATAGGCGGLTVEIPGRLPVPRKTPRQLLRELEPALGLAFP